MNNMAIYVLGFVTGMLFLSIILKRKYKDNCAWALDMSRESKEPKSKDLFMEEVKKREHERKEEETERLNFEKNKRSRYYIKK